MQGIIKMGPWGGPGGSKWSQCGDSPVLKVVIAHGWAIDSIKFLTNTAGKECWSKQNGGNGGTKDEINIRYPDEYMTSISGHIDNFFGFLIIRSLTICTNCEEYGPYGQQKGTPFSIPIYGGVIVGFHGKAGQFLDSLGIFVKPIGSVFSSDGDMKKCSAMPIKTMASPPIEIAEKELCKPLPIAWGGVGGKPWDDGVFSRIKKIYIHTDGDVINGFEVLYKTQGSAEISCIHGSSHGFTDGVIELDDMEHLVCISGYYGTATRTDEFEVIKSLTFFTNKAKYGPIGDEIGKYFCTAHSFSVSGEVTGFFGRSSSYLDAIGVHMRYY